MAPSERHASPHLTRLPVRPVLMKGNEAMAEAAIQAGCDAYFGYPITPQAELLEWMARRMPEVGRVFVQAESELAAINMALGAAATGARVLVSSSSPGISLMAEGMSYLAGSELPMVLVNVMRGGPGLGSIGPAAGRLLPGHQGPRPRRLPRAGPRPVVDRRGRRARRRRVRARGALPDAGDHPRRRRHGPGDGAGRAGLPARRRAAPGGWELTGADGRPPRVVRSLHLRPEDLEAHNRAPPGEVRPDRRRARCAGRARTSTTPRSRSSPTARRPASPGPPSSGRARAGSAPGSSGRSRLWPFPSDELADVAPTACGRSSSSSCRRARWSRTSASPSRAGPGLLPRPDGRHGPDARRSRRRPARAWACAEPPATVPDGRGRGRPAEPIDDGAGRSRDRRGDEHDRCGPPRRGRSTGGRTLLTDRRHALLPRLRPRHHPPARRRAARRAGRRTDDHRRRLGRLLRLRLRLLRRRLRRGAARPRAGRRDRRPARPAGRVRPHLPGRRRPRRHRHGRDRPRRGARRAHHRRSSSTTASTA